MTVICRFAPSPTGKLHVGNVRTALMNWLFVRDKFPAYEAAAKKLRDIGRLYPCYETGEELDRQRKLQRVQGKPPVYNRAALELTDEQIAAYEAEGRKPHWRFKLTGRTVTWVDMVRGDQSVDTSSLSDPVLIRGDGSFLYTLPSVVDDIDEGITHVIRGEDHVTNSGAQTALGLERRLAAL